VIPFYVCTHLITGSQAEALFLESGLLLTHVAGAAVSGLGFAGNRMPPIR
jgi:hypothetical protein